MHTFASTVWLTSIQLALAFAAMENLIVHQMDVKTAYLEGTLDEEIYMKAPEGYNSHEKVLQLLRSLYRLKQSARVWNYRLRNYLVANGY
jgi:hypothetical protein